MARTDRSLGQRYRLIRRIASGGMGTVWEAQDSVLDRRVAVKVLAHGLAGDPQALERFRREARAAAGLAHPNVADVYDYGEDDERPYIVMELLEGETLAARLARGPLEPAEAVAVATQIAGALQAAHDVGIVHRDVKPSNVMLAAGGDVKVMDFGIAAAAGAASLTATGRTMGTAAYLSPEQAAGRPATPASDVYALGVVLYEMLSGRPPFAGDSPVAVATAHIKAEPPALSDLAPGVPEHLVEACRQALAKDPARRPPSAAAFAATLASDGSTGAEPAGAAGAAATQVIAPPDTTAVLPGGGTRAREASAARAAASRGRVGRGGAAPGGLRLPSPLIAAMVIAALVLLGIVVASALGRSPAPLPTAAVPAVVGMERPEAEAAVAEAGLRVEEIREKDGEPGVVLGAEPAPGTTLARGSAVTLIVGAAPADTPPGGPAVPGGQGKGNREGQGKAKGKDASQGDEGEDD